MEKLSAEDKEHVARIDECNGQMISLALRLQHEQIGKLIAEKEDQNKELSAAKENLTRTRKELLQVKDELNLYKPGNAIADDGELVAVTAKQIEVTGKKFVGKHVKLVNCRFLNADTTWIDLLTGVTVSSNGLMSVIRKSEFEKWIGFSFDDSDGTFFQRGFGSMAKYGDLMAGWKRGTKISIQGTVVELHHPGWYGIVVDKIEVAE